MNRPVARIPGRALMLRPLDRKVFGHNINRATNNPIRPPPRLLRSPPLSSPGLFAATTALDSLLFRDAFGTPEMRDVFVDRSTIARYVDVEVALARAEARCGVIPEAAAQQIASMV